MPRALDRPTEDQLLSWIETSLAAGTHRLGSGYQAQTLLYEDGPQRLVIKAPGGRGLYRWFSRWMIGRELHAYRQLDGLNGIPRCYGMVGNRYLILEYIAGEPARYADITDRDQFFSDLLHLIVSMHARGVAHGDLQKKDNLWVVDGRHPVLLDFGASIVKRTGFAPLNAWLYRLVSQLDFNQWAKLKTRGRPDRLSVAEKQFYRRTLPERVASALKYPFRRIRKKVRP